MAAVVFLLIGVASAPAAAPPSPAPLPPGAVARLGTLAFRHGQWIRGVDLSSDGKLLVTASGQHVRLWQAPAGKELSRLDLPEQLDAESVALSPDGKTLAVAGRTGVGLMDVASGKLILRLEVKHFWSVTFAPDGRSFAASGLLGGFVWEIATGKVVSRIVGTSGALAFSRDGRLLARSSGRQAVLRDMRPGKGAERLFDHGATVRAIAFSPDGRVLAAAADGAIHLWDVAGEKRLRKLAGHAAEVKALAFSPDGKLLASGSGDPLQGGAGKDLHALRLWDVATGAELAKLGSHAEGIAAVRFCADGKVLYAATHMSVHPWDVATRRQIPEGDGHQGWVGDIAYSPDGKTLATGGSDMAVRLWDRATGRERQALLGCEAVVDSVACSPGGARLAAGCRDGRVLVWDAATGREVARLQVGGCNWEAKVAFSPDGKLLAGGSRDGQLVLWDAKTFREVRRIPGLEVGVMSLAFSPDNKSLAAGSIVDGKGLPTASDLVRLWDVSTGKEIRRFAGPQTFMVTSVAFSPDGHLLAAGDWTHTVQLWDVATGQVRRSVEAAGTGGNRVAFSPDGRMLATLGHDASARLWEVATGAQRRRYTGQRGMGTALAFAPDGLTVSTGSMDTTVLLWGVRARAGKGLSQREIERHWDALAGADTARAYEAVLALAAAGRPAVAFLSRQLRPAAGDGKRIGRLLEELDSDEFAVRERATGELEKMGEAAEPALRQALERGGSLEVRRRAERLLQKLVGRPLSARDLRQLRAVEALEYAGTPEARRLLEVLGGGDAEARLTREAKRALARMSGKR